MGMNRMADALTATATAYGRDDDPEFVRTGAPATLKMIEMMLDRQPTHAGLLSAACSGYTQYAFAFLHLESEMTEDRAAAGELGRRGARMYARARGYCLRALARRQPEVAAALTGAPRSAVGMLDRMDKDAVPVLFWTAASWAGELALGDDLLVRISELAVVRALFERALALDASWDGGAIHEAMIAIEGLPALAGGSPERAKRHFDRAVELSGGASAVPYVTLAASVSVRSGNRKEFETLLKQALAVDVSRKPDLRLANLLAQRRAKYLLSSADRLFGSKPG
jgi:hypothetical protein